MHSARCAKVDPTVTAGRDGHVPAGEDGRHGPGSELRIGVDLTGEQADQHRRSLGVADEDDRSAVIEVGQVVLPGGEDTVVGDPVRCWVVPQPLQQRRLGPLSVHRGPDPADLGERRGLGDGGPDLGAWTSRLALSLTWVLTVGYT